MPSDKILIVDDEAAIREMISIALDLAGYNCIEAEDALQAHHLVVDERPALILLDWMLPGMRAASNAMKVRARSPSLCSLLAARKIIKCKA